MSRKLLTALCIALLTFGLAGIASADDGNPYSTAEPWSLIQIDQEHVAMPATDSMNEQDQLEQINPLFCTEELVEENERVATNTCTEEDLLVNEG